VVAVAKAFLSSVAFFSAATLFFLASSLSTSYVKVLATFQVVPKLAALQSSEVCYLCVLACSTKDAITSTTLPEATVTFFKPFF